MALASLAIFTSHDVNDRYGYYTSPVNAFTKIAILNTVPCFAGHCDWRMPNVNELLTLVIYGTNNPGIDPVFHNGVDSFTNDTYFSSTPALSGSGAVWSVGFGNGGGGASQSQNNNAVRAVRGP